MQPSIKGGNNQASKLPQRVQHASGKPLPNEHQVFETQAEISRRKNNFGDERDERASDVSEHATRPSHGPRRGMLYFWLWIWHESSFKILLRSQECWSWVHNVLGLLGPGHSAGALHRLCRALLLHGRLEATWSQLDGGRPEERLEASSPTTRACRLLSQVGKKARATLSQDT